MCGRVDPESGVVDDLAENFDENSSRVSLMTALNGFGGFSWCSINDFVKISRWCPPTCAFGGKVQFPILAHLGPNTV